MMRSGSTLLSLTSVWVLTAKETFDECLDTYMFGKSHDCLSMEEISGYQLRS